MEEHTWSSWAAGRICFLELCGVPGFFLCEYSVNHTWVFRAVLCDVKLCIKDEKDLAAKCVCMGSGRLA